jgi:hypothetical protein
MGIRKGLAAYDKAEEERKATSGIRWFKMTDGQVLKIRFLDELDESAPNVLKGAGVVNVISEHNHPKEFKRKAQCTSEEGRCWACEHAIANPKSGWGKKNRLYANVLVNNGTEEPFVALLSWGMARNSALEQLRETWIDEGQVSNREWRIRRTGSGPQDTTYLLKDLGVDDFDAFNDYEKIDLDHVVREVPYEEQKAFYMGTDEEPDDVDDSDWV